MLNKNNKLLLAIIIFLIIVTIGLLIVIYHNKNKEEKPKENVKSSLKKSVPQSQLDEMISKIEKFYLRALDFYDKKEFTNEDIDDYQYELFSKYIISVNAESWQNHFDNNVSWSVPKDELDFYFKELYGFTPNVYKDIICRNDNIALLKYDEENNLYTWNDEHPGHGSPIYDFLDYYIVDSKINDNEYSITLLFLYGNIAEGYYVNGKELEIDAASEISDENYDDFYKRYFKENIEDFKDYIKYKYTFEKNNDEFYLKSFEKLN